MTDKNEIEDFTGFGNDDNETTLEFVKEFNELLSDFLAVCDDVVEKAAIAEFVSNEICLLLSSEEPDLEIEKEVLDSYDSVFEAFESMVHEQYQNLMETTEPELLAEILKESEEIIEEFGTDEILNREFIILITAKDILNPSSCDCGCECGDDCGDDCCSDESKE